MNKNKRKGFTLLEILLVIAAIGILAAIVLVAINPTRQIAQVRNTQRRSDINAIYKALEQYLIDNKTYPIGITASKQDICDTGTEQVGGSTDCTGKADLRVLVPIYLAAIPKDPSGVVYEVYRNPDNNRIGVEAPGVELGLSIVVNPISTTPALGMTSCPTGYILVPGNSLYNTNNFCVMKYEAKAVQTNNPTVGLIDPSSNGTIDNNLTATTSANGRAISSVASGYPISNVTRPTAADYCTNQNTVSGASLITNSEWMTIARNIEAQGANWTGGTVGSGQLWRGHADGNPSNLLAASTDDNQGYEGTLNSSPSTEKRTHTLSNGQVIWDLSGNIWEWTNDTILGENKPTDSSGNQNVPGIYNGFPWQEWTSISNWGSLGPDAYRPSNNTWNSAQNMGLYVAGGLTGSSFGFLRGGGNTDPQGPITGIYTLLLNFQETSTNQIIGFRCVIK